VSEAVAQSWQRVTETCPNCLKDTDVKRRGKTLKCFRCDLHFVAGAPGEKPAAPLTEEQVEGPHRKLLTNEKILTYLQTTRCLTLPVIERRKLGLAGGELVIPIPTGTKGWAYAMHGRPWLPQADRRKMLSPKGAKATLYPLPVDTSRPVYLFEGFWDALAAESMGLNAIAGTAGASVFYDHWGAMLKDAPAVVVCYDTDKAGLLGATRVANVLVKQGVHQGKIRLVTLPLAAEHGKDFLDWVRHRSGTREQFEQIVETTPTFRARSVPVEIDETVYDEPLRSSGTEAFAGKWCKFKATVASVSETPWLVPKTITVNCSKHELVCPTCAIADEDVPFEEPLKVFDTSYLTLIDTSFEKQIPRLKGLLGIPGKCPSATLSPATSQNVYEMRLTEQFKLEVDRESRHYRALGMGVDLKPNETYEVVARAVSDPRSQLRIHTIREAQPSVDDLSAYVHDEKTTRTVLRPKRVRVAEHVDTLLRDAALITARIGRPDLHLLYLLAYTSTLWIQWDKREKIRGWLDVLVLGDSGQGKSTTFLALQAWMGLGEYVVLKKATEAGLLGGRVEQGGRYWIQWGIDPRGDKRLVFYDEIKGTPTKTLAVLTAARSSGYAEFTLVDGHARTHARTRRVWASNARTVGSDAVTMGDFGYPVLAIPRLWGSAEDVRRLDAALCVVTGEVPIEDYRKAKAGEPTILTQDVLNKLVMRAWTQAPVVLDDKVRGACLDGASYLGERYSAEIPLVEPADQREKVARLAVALANLTCEGVTPEHVEYVVAWLDRIYSSPAMGYLAYSQTTKRMDKLEDVNAVRTALVAGTNKPKALFKLLLARPVIAANEFREFFPDRQQADVILSELLLQNALRRTSHGYTKTQGFTDALRAWSAKETP
jgi:hypothetical protein